jgi:hypothetical protein
MSTVLERPRTRSNGGTVLSGSLAQVNLLPPEVRAARGLKKTKQWLLISLVVTLLVAVGGWGLALISSVSAATDLVQAQDETTRLQTEQAKYAEVPQVLGALEQTKTSRTVGMSTEVQWKPYLDALSAVLPANVSIDNFQFTGATPVVPPTLPSNPLQDPSVGQILFTVRASVIPDTAAWIDAMNSVPGFSDAFVSSAAVTEDDTGIYYNMSGSVQVTDVAYSHRFDAGEGEG